MLRRRVLHYAWLYALWLALLAGVHGWLLQDVGGSGMRAVYDRIERPGQALLVTWNNTWFLYALMLFFLSMIGLAVSIWPDVIPGRVSIWQAAAPYESQLFMLVGAAVLMPLILGYTAWVYFIFRGKVRPDAGYH